MVVYESISYWTDFFQRLSVNWFGGEEFGQVGTDETGALGFVLADGLAKLGQEGEAEGVVFVGAIVYDAVLVDVEDGTEQKLGLVDGVGEVCDVGEIAERHADDIVDAQWGLTGDFGVTAVIEVLLVRIEIAGWCIWKEA